jgi:murein DD-endopeptidase MepM/ murein hydrolase activator NlpD
MAINRQSNPKVQQVKQPKDISQYLTDLDALLKRNTGSGTFQGQDTSSNTPMYLPGKVVNPTGLSETPSTMAYGNGMTTPTPVQRDAPEVYQEPQQQQPLSAIDFLQQFEQSYNAPENQQQFGDPQLEGVMSTRDGGTVLADGTIVYEDGTYRQGDPNAEAIRSNTDGSIGYSDGSSRKPAPEAISSLYGQRERIGYSDGSARYGQYQYREGQPQADLPGGVEGLSRGVFGKNQFVTQAYGNYNPAIEPGRGYNTGTDFRTNDLTGDNRNLKLPLGAEVVEVYSSSRPGSGYVGNRENKGWGNSVVVRLETGEMLRFSHLDSVANIQPGQRLEAGQPFGTPGSTGNVTGEHADVVYYDRSGNISDLAQFSGWSNPQGLRTPLPGQPAPGTVAPTGAEPTMSQMPQPVVEQPQMSTPQRTTSQVSAPPQPAPAPKNIFNKVQEATPELGLSEGLFTPEAKDARISAVAESPKQYNPLRQLVGNVSERIGDTLGIPESGFSEALAGGQTKRTNQAMADEINGNRSAAVPGIRENLSDIGTGIKDTTSNALASAGQGIKSLGQSGVDALQNVFQPKQDVPKRAVGDVAGTASSPTQSGQFSSLMDTAQSMANIPKNDVRDPFFKYGGSEMYKSFLRPDAEGVNGGALSLDTFTPDFYKDLGNISSVFGGSKDLSPATEKYVANEQQKYPTMSKMGYSDEYDRGSIDEYNAGIDKYNSSLSDYFNSIRSSVNGAQSIFTPLPTGSSRNIFAASAPQMSVRPGSSAPQMSVMPKAPQQSFAPPRASVSAPSYAQAFAPQQSNRPGSSAPQMSVAPRPQQNMSVAPRMSVAPKQAPQMSVAPRMSVAPKPQMSVAPKPAPQMSMAPKPQSKPSSNVFSKVTSAIKNIFRR